ncbi:MAG: hypothetical protein A3A94_00110 [Candidatus Portnoybacteria bacterium RIFCSPLOWO2_01_FULL_43_11]|uniref:M23ase beta-sheet core domain-containing protein n=3 Tax=Bacteria candidate phyla TaxID=1783234 RepID=A0A1G2FM26_9BACT|nr:MAG: hypothetical protein A2713_00715 [candidate division WWE3 bacterium RIFCSPHIGHO2_01_FULL_35_17]OGZ38304.1 MAG: hypothetical protein A3A94_00110 [Candidatus Portnoybacteria bacterium RIFCSPLOWO2_01_FULL_43_11]OGZ39083.1 MAG: hypothetical protein A3E90_00785 [Candidatus Portnoybacteria bacterium RIFCSPHIGHO2_12_FULL_40_11]
MKRVIILWLLLFCLITTGTAIKVFGVTLDGFDFPVGIPDYVSQTKTISYTKWWLCQDFLEYVKDDCSTINSPPNGTHLGEDWNLGSGDHDVGKPVYAIANGKVIRSGSYGSGWGNVVMIKHDLLPWDKENYEYVVSLYAHLGDNRQVSTDDYVRRGQVIGFIGSRSENGGYSPHLHLELRSDKIATRFGKDTYRGCGYLNDALCNITDSTGWLDPSDFIEAHRPSPIPLSGDWDNDGIDTTGFFTPGTTCGEECQAQGGSAEPPKFSLDNGAPIEFGQAGDYPIIGDWDNNGYDNIGLFRLIRNRARFYLDTNNDGGLADYRIGFPHLQDLPIVGDWDGLNGDDLGGYDALTSTFYLYTLNYQAETITFYKSIQFGDSTKRDYPVIGDWDNDIKDDLGVFRARFPNNSTNTFFLAKGQTTETDHSYEMGKVGDMPVIGDWFPSDGNDNIGLYDPATGEFFLEPNIPSFANPDATAISDIIKRAESDNRFKSAIAESFGKNLNWLPEWELRWMDFNFSWGRIVRIYHATNKSDSSRRGTIFWDPDIGDWTSWESVYSLDQQAKRDMINESKNDFRFGDYIPGTFGKNLDWSAEWELRWMDFSFYGNRVVRIYHATKKTDSSVRYTIFWDPDVHSWTDWIKVK